MGFDIRGDNTQANGVRTIGGIDNVTIGNNFVHGQGTSLSNRGITTEDAVDSIFVFGNSVFAVQNDAITIFTSASASSITVNDNRVLAGTTVNSDNGIEIVASVGAGTNVTVTSNWIEGGGGQGIIVSNGNVVAVTSNTIGSTVANAIGADAIRVIGGSTGSQISNNVIGGIPGNLLTVAGSGIHLISAAGNYSILNNRIFEGVTGLFIDHGGAGGTANISTSGNTIGSATDPITGDGISVANASTNNLTVQFGATTITNVGDAGIDVADNAAGGLTTLTFNNGVIVNDATRGVVIGGASPSTGQDTRITGQTFGNLVLGSDAGANQITGNYIELQNAALHGNPNGTPFDPLEYNAQNVTFNGVTAASLDPAGSPANQAALAAIEGRIVHYLDTTLADYNAAPTRNMRGLIRLRTDSFSLDGTVGLNGVQLAVTASNAGDTIYLAAGRFADASDLLPIINQELTGVANDWLLIDRDITILGAQAGVSAATGGRTANDQTTESILDFDLATGGNGGGVVIASSGVIIDGVSIRAASAQDFGVRIYSGALGTLGNGPANNLLFVNNFVQGGSSTIGGHGIEAFGGGTISNLTIVGNAINGVNLDGVNLNTIRGLTLQNNLVGTGPGPATVGDDGFDVSNVTFATSVSGNTIFNTGDDGMVFDNALLPTTLTNAISVINNTVGSAGGDGIEIANFGAVDVLSNTVNVVDDHGIFVRGTSGLVRVGAGSTTGNTVDGTGLNGIYVSATGNTIGGAGGVQVSHNLVGQTGNIGTSPNGGNGIHVEIRMPVT